MQRLLFGIRTCVVLTIATVLVGAAPGCRTTTPTQEAIGPRKPVYRPGRSIAESRLCECRECLEAACCSGDPESESTPANETLGLAIASCSRCFKRVWTVRGDDSCDLLRPRECCADREDG